MIPNGRALMHPSIFRVPQLPSNTSTVESEHLHTRSIMCPELLRYMGSWSGCVAAMSCEADRYIIYFGSKPTKYTRSSYSQEPPNAQRKPQLKTSST